jgi:hypothetical protein
MILAWGLMAAPGAVFAQALSDAALAQIESLLVDKAARSPVQRKVGSQLLYEARMSRGQPVAPGVPFLRTSVELDANGRALVDVRAQVDDVVLARVDALGGSLVDVQRARGSFRAWLPLDQVEALAESPNVDAVRPKPELAAADCVSTATPGFATFCGTSAAAPHAAALAALLWDLAAGSGALPGDLLAALTGTALDIEAVGLDVDSGDGLVTGLAAASALSASCNDGVDNDGDGFADFAGGDPGCYFAGDASERSPLLPCDDGIDNDGDGRIDFRADASGDLGCAAPSGVREDPQCQDGIDNDGVVGTDFDGGESVLGAGSGDPDGADPQCSAPSTGRESAGSSCGLGFELVPALLLMAPLARRRRARTLA